jgi:hypothetical protein
VPVYQREFTNGKAVFNASSREYRVDLSSGGPWTTTSGDLLPSTFTVPAKSGMIFLSAPAVPVVCTPRPAITVKVTKLEPDRFEAVLTAGSTAGNISRIQILRTQNATISIDGGPSNTSGAQTYTPTSRVTSVRIVLNRVSSGQMIVPMIVTDGCGDWHTFAGAGNGV